MNLNEVVENFNIFAEPEGRLSVLFVTKNGTRYKSSKPQITNDVKTKIIELFRSNLKEKIESGLKEIDYNPSGQEQDEYSTCSFEYVGNYEEVINLFDSPQIEELEVGKVSFLIFRLRINEDEEDPKFIYLFRRNYKFKNIRKGFWLNKVSNTYNILDNELIGIDGNIDAISYNDQIAFLSHISAERIFNLREKFTENASQVLQEVQNGGKIENFDDFEEDCLEDARILRRLTKIHSNPEILHLFHQHFDNAPNVVEEFDLDIEFNEDKTKIIYNSKEQLKDITMLMRDAYYTTMLLNRKGINDYN